MQLAFLKTLSQDPQNIVVGLVRDKVAADERISREGLKNVTIIQADITDREALDVSRDLQGKITRTLTVWCPPWQAAAAQVSKLTDGSLNYPINNAAYVSESTAVKRCLNCKTLSLHRVAIIQLGSDQVCSVSPQEMTELTNDLAISLDVNLCGVPHTTNAFLPLLLSSS